MPINATLTRLVLASPQPALMAAFYSNAFGYGVQEDGQIPRLWSLWIKRLGDVDLDA